MTSILFANLAYVGPGPGLTMVAALIALGLTVLSALGAVLLWPIRLLLRRIRAGRAEASAGGERELAVAPQPAD